MARVWLWVTPTRRHRARRRHRRKKRAKNKCVMRSAARRNILLPPPRAGKGVIWSAQTPQAVVFLLMTNAVSVMVAMYAMRVARAFSPSQQQARTAAERKLDALLRRGAQSRLASGSIRDRPARAPARGGRPERHG